MLRIRSYDVGSMPFFGDFEKLSRGATSFNSLLSLLYGKDHSAFEPIRYFEKEVIRVFLDKLEAGITAPNYPQFRDMNTMFLDSIDGIQETEDGYAVVEDLSVRPEMTKIPEVQAVKRNSRYIYEKIGAPFKVKVCITGPYTLSSLFVDRRVNIFGELDEILSSFVSNNIYKDKYSTVDLVAIDEPVFGFLSDSMIDYGTEGREELRKAWERIFHKATSRGVRSCIHLHSTVDELFWEIDSLNIIESHVDDPIYKFKRTKQLLEKTDKFLKASICITDFDRLVREKILTTLNRKKDESTLMESVGKTWVEIKQGKYDPKEFLETVDTMKRRLAEMIDRYGIERVLYAGPECGMKSFPTYECALECLKRVSDALKTNQMTN
ncbi:MAG: hypothetical protein H3Z50_03565 [archaeon]|nr:hypothetical protein [archaeon]